MAQRGSSDNGQNHRAQTFSPMPLIERYLFRQLLVPTLWALAALGALGLLSQTLTGLDIIVDSRQSIWVFVRITLLAMPQLISILAPVAMFTAALITLNRLQIEREITVCFAGGVSRWGVVAPCLRLACLVSLVALVINLWVQPWAQRAQRDEIYAVRGDLAATLVREGDFTYPTPDLTVYAQEVGRRGMIKNLFINQKTKDGTEFTYTAREARILPGDTAPVLVMFDGSVQTFSKGELTYGTFRESPFKLDTLTAKTNNRRYKAVDRYLHELVFPDLSQPWEQANRTKLLAEAHSRIASPLYNIAVMAMALAAVLGGGFSRLGYGKRIAITAASATAIRILGFGIQAACEDVAWLNILQYVVPLAAMAWSMSVLFKSTLPNSKARRPAFRLRTA
ncbi:LPS export ABC transporter permease LptF [soil metagenome]